MNPDEEHHDHNSARSTRSDALYFQRRLASRPSLLNPLSPDHNPPDTSPGSTVQSTPSINSFANSAEEAKSSRLLHPRPFLETILSPRIPRPNHPDSTDDPTEINKDVFAFVTDKAIRDNQSDASSLQATSSVLNPEGRFISLWDTFILVLLVYVVYVSVYVYSFLGILSPSSPWFWVERFLDLAFLTDIVLSFFTAYYKPNGDLEKDPQKIRRRYLFTWFPLDALATFPWDIIALGVYGTDSVGPSILLLPRFLRLLRLTRLFRLARLLRMNKRFTDFEVKLRVKYGYLRLVTLFFTVTLIAHWFACLFFYFGAITASTCQVGENCVHVNWFEREDGDGDIPKGDFGRYVAALYFSVYTITTIGYGDVVPENTAERMYVIVIMFLGAAMFAYVISQVSNIQDDLNESSAEHRKKMDQLTDFAKNRDLAHGLQMRIREWFQREYRRQRVLDEKKLLEGITGDLRKEVLEYIYERQMLGSKLIQAIPKEKRGQVYMSINEFTVQGGSTVYSRGEKPKGFYVIQEGKVEVQLSDGSLHEYGKGEIFGEDGIMFQRAREEKAVCTEDTDLIEVPRKALMQVLDETEKLRKKLEEEETLKLWQNSIKAVEAQIRYAKVARDLREKAEADFRARGIVVVNRSYAVERGAEGRLENSLSAFSMSEESRRGGTERDEEESLTDGGRREEMDGLGEMERMRAELEEKRRQVRSLEDQLERLQNQLNEIASGIGAMGSRE